MTPVKTEKNKLKRDKLTYQEQKEWDTIEDDIENIESKLESIEIEIEEAGSNSVKVQEFFKKQSEVELELGVKMERWEKLSLLVEEINENKNKS